MLESNQYLEKSIAQAEKVVLNTSSVAEQLKSSLSVFLKDEGNVIDPIICVIPRRK